METLEAKKRDNKENLDKIRKGGEMPAVFYGRKTESTSITIPAGKFKSVWKEAGESTVFTLKIDGKELQVLIHDIDIHPVTDEVRHVDFYVVEKGQMVKVAVSIEFVGESPAVKKLGGTLIKVLHEIEVEAEPKDLPKNIEIDISSLENFGDHIAIKDLKLPTEVKILADSEDVIVSVSEAKEEIIEEAPKEEVEGGEESEKTEETTEEKSGGETPKEEKTKE